MSGGPAGTGSGAAAADDIRAAKAALRADLRRRLAAVTAEEAAAAGAAAAARLRALPELATARRLLLCLSFGGEIDTWRLAEELAGDGREVFVPRTAAGDERLHVHPWPCELATLSFGLRQPRAECPEVPPEAVDGTLEAAVVLGLCFDRRGYRLGYGRGYFDRFLAARRFPAVGLAHAFQLVERVPSVRHDVPMRVVVTDSETHRPL